MENRPKSDLKWYIAQAKDKKKNRFTAIYLRLYRELGKPFAQLTQAEKDSLEQAALTELEKEFPPSDNKENPAP